MTTAQIRNASATDLQHLKSLNQKWQKSALDSNLQDGYIGAAFSDETFLELINRKQVVVAEAEQIIEGYYLLNDFSKDGVIGRHAEIVKQLKATKAIASDLIVIVGAQAVVDKGFMGSGILIKMLDLLVENVRDKCDLLFATIAKDNHRAFHAHTNDGWEVVGEEELLYYVIYKVK